MTSLDQTAGLRRAEGEAAPPRPAGKLHVLLVAPYAPRGGGMGRIMAYLAAEPCQDEIEFEMIESRGGGSAIASLWPLAQAIWRIRHRARHAENVIVHVNMAEGSSVWRKGLLLLFSRRLGLVTVLHLHAADIITFYDRLPPIGRAVVRGVFRRATVCIVLGQPWADWLQTRLGIAPCRIEIVRNGVPAPSVLPFASRRGPRLLVFIGNLLPRKGVTNLLTALADTTLQGRHWELVIAGGGDAAAMKARAQLLGIADRVRFSGWLDRPAMLALLARAFTLILPSTHEGLPLVLLEAASLGCPVVTTPVGAIPEIFTHEQTALFVPPGDPTALAAAIRRLMDDPPLHADIARNARLLFQNRLTLPIFRARLATIYRQYGAHPGCRARG